MQGRAAKKTFIGQVGNTMTECVVCRTETNKYKCPKCRKFYCSVACCKVHKESCEEGDTSQPAKDSDREDDEHQAATPTPLSGVDVLTSKQIDKLKSDPYMKRILGSKRLQEHIRAIDSAEDRAGALQKRRKLNREFHDFVQKMMVTVEDTL
jgi:hypothetical protein